MLSIVDRRIIFMQLLLALNGLFVPVSLYLCSLERSGRGGEERINTKDEYKNTPATVFKDETRRDEMR